VTYTCSDPSIHSAPPRWPETLLLVVKGIGPPPSFKNSKMLTRGKLITDPKKQRWMQAAQALIESQLLFKCPTDESGTVTAAKLRSWIASATPENDSCAYLTECSWRFMKVPKKQEGAILLVTKTENDIDKPKAV
jgi:hypothetical protein